MLRWRPRRYARRSCFTGLPFIESLPYAEHCAERWASTVLFFSFFNMRKWRLEVYICTRGHSMGWEPAFSSRFFKTPKPMHSRDPLLLACHWGALRLLGSWLPCPEGWRVLGFYLSWGGKDSVGGEGWESSGPPWGCWAQVKEWWRLVWVLASTSKHKAKALLLLHEAVCPGSGSGWSPSWERGEWEPVADPTCLRAIVLVFHQERVWLVWEGHELYLWILSGVWDVPVHFSSLHYELVSLNNVEAPQLGVSRAVAEWRWRPQLGLWVLSWWGTAKTVR